MKFNFIIDANTSEKLNLSQGYSIALYKNIKINSINKFFQLTVA